MNRMTGMMIASEKQMLITALTSDTMLVICGTVLPAAANPFIICAAGSLMKMYMMMMMKV